MHDLGVRIASTVLVSGVLLFAAFVFYSILYPRKASASPSGGSAGIATMSAPAANYGYLAPVSRSLEWTLRQAQERITYRTGRSSWGWAIVLTTCVVNLLLLPFRILAARQAKIMQALQPQVDAINARYKKRGASRFEIDPQQSREISELYKQHKTHPLSGCIPAIGPFVVLAAFYSVLTRVAELHGAPWLWIADLSRPEQLPIRVLPLLMIATQLILQRITPNPQVDPKMARLMTWMPLAFGVLFYRQPSALLLYWVTSNILAIAQQKWLAGPASQPAR